MIYIEKQKHAQDGFTLVEILIAAALVMILGGIVTYSVQGILESNRKKSTALSLKFIRDRIEAYNDDTGEYPRNLVDLIKKPADEKIAESWDGPYITAKKGEVPKDGWNKPFHYEPTEGGEHPFELYSYGSKRGKGTPKSEWIDAWKQ
jgi:general secretion pathway protein G